MANDNGKDITIEETEIIEEIPGTSNLAGVDSQGQDNSVDGDIEADDIEADDIEADDIEDDDIEDDDIEDDDVEDDDSSVGSDFTIPKGGKNHKKMPEEKGDKNPEELPEQLSNELPEGNGTETSDKVGNGDTNSDKTKKEKPEENEDKNLDDTKNPTEDSADAQKTNNEPSSNESDAKKMAKTAKKIDDTVSDAEKLDEAAKKAANTAENAEKMAEATEKTAELAEVVGEGTAAAGEGAAAAAGAASGPPGWVLLAIGIILKIIGWIKKHPYEAIAILVLAMGIALLPIILPVVVIYAMVQLLWEWVSGLFNFSGKDAVRILDNITFGIFDFETSYDVNKYMKLLEGYTDADYEVRAKELGELNNKKSNLENKIVDLEKQKKELEAKGESVAEIDEQIADAQKEIADMQDKINEVESKYGVSIESVDSESGTRDAMLDMYDMSKDYYDEIYVKDHSETINGEEITLPADLQTNDDNTNNWINLSQKEKSKYLATTVYGLSEEMVENLYYGKFYSDKEFQNISEKLEVDNEYYYDKSVVSLKYDGKNADGKILYIDSNCQTVASSLDVDKIYYYIKDFKTFNYSGDKTIKKSNLYAYYNMLGGKKVDRIASENLEAYGVENLEKSNTAWNELSITGQDTEIKNLVRVRLQSYVSAENRFWSRQGEEKLSIDKLQSGRYGIPIGTVSEHAEKLLDNLEISNEMELSNGGIKTEGYRVVETEEYNAEMAFREKNGKWVLYPYASYDFNIEPKVENNWLKDFIKKALGIENPINTLTEKAEPVEDWNEDETIFEEILFSYRLSEENIPNSEYYVYMHNGEGYYVDIDANGSAKKYEAENHVIQDGWLYEVDYNIKWVTPPEFERRGGGLIVRATGEKIVTFDEENNSVITDKGTVLEFDESYRVNASVRSITVAEEEISYEQVKLWGKPIRIITKDDFIVEFDTSKYTPEDIDDLISKGNYIRNNEFKYLPVNDWLYGINIGYKFILRHSDNTSKMNEAQQAVYRIYKDGENEDDASFWTKVGNWFGGNGWSSNQEVVDKAISESGLDGSVDLSNINSVNEFMKGTDFELIDERELLKPYGIPSAFAYFVPLEESTRNIPFLIALAQEMKNTVILMSPLDDETSVMKEEVWTYDIKTLDEDGAKNKLVEAWRSFVEKYGLASDEIRNHQLTLRRTPVRDIIYAKLWDREIVNDFRRVVSTRGNNNGETFENIGSDENASNVKLSDIENGAYIKHVEYILANQYIVYNDKPYELITKYNVSQADVGIYEEVTGRPFLTAYSYEKLLEKDALKEEWDGALEASKILSPVAKEKIYALKMINRDEDNGYGTSETKVLAKDSEELRAFSDGMIDKNGKDPNVIGIRFNGASDVVAVKKGEVIAKVNRTTQGEYSNYIILYHEEDKSFSMYSNLDKFNNELVEGSIVEMGEYIGSYVADLKVNDVLMDAFYFEYRQGGGDHKDFWVTTPMNLCDKLANSIEELESKGEEVVPDGEFDEGIDEESNSSSGNVVNRDVQEVAFGE